MRENQFTFTLMSVLKEQGAMIYPLVAGQYSPRGWPDRLIVHKKWQGLLELKGASTKLEPLQALTIWDINQRWRGAAWVVREAEPRTVEVADTSRWTDPRVRYVEIVRASCAYEELLDTLVKLGRGEYDPGGSP